MEFFNQVSTSKNQENLQPDLQVFLRTILEKISDNNYVNKKLELEIVLQQISEKLEQEIQARTALLNSRVDQLQQEINEYKQAEAARQETEQSFRRHNTALQKLVQSESLQYDDFPTAIKYVTEVASLGLDVEWSVFGYTLKTIPKFSVLIYMNVQVILTVLVGNCQSVTIRAIFKL